MSIRSQGSRYVTTTLSGTSNGNLSLQATSAGGIQHLARSISVTFSGTSGSARLATLYDGTTAGTAMWNAYVDHTYTHTWEDMGGTIGNPMTLVVQGSTTTNITVAAGFEYVPRRVTASTS